MLKKSNYTKTSITINNDILKKIDDIAKEHRRNRSQEIEMILYKYLKQKKEGTYPS